MEIEQTVDGNEAEKSEVIEFKLEVGKTYEVRNPEFCKREGYPYKVTILEND